MHATDKINKKDSVRWSTLAAAANYDGSGLERMGVGVGAGVGGMAQFSG